MHKTFFKISALIIGFATFFATFTFTPVFADNQNEKNCVETTFFGEQCGEEGITTVLKTIADVMTAGIAILAVIGIVVSGIQYLTASGNEEQLKKSKRRIFEIVIGLAAYVLIYAFLRWLLPGFPSSGSGGK